MSATIHDMEVYLLPAAIERAVPLQMNFGKDKGWAAPVGSRSATVWLPSGGPIGGGRDAGQLNHRRRGCRGGSGSHHNARCGEVDGSLADTGRSTQGIAADVPGTLGDCQVQQQS